MTPPPGSKAAIDIGCTCPVLDNSHGKGHFGVAGLYVFRADCPVHCETTPKQRRAGK